MYGEKRERWKGGEGEGGKTKKEGGEEMEKRTETVKRWIGGEL